MSDKDKKPHDEAPIVEAPKEQRFSYTCLKPYFIYLSVAVFSIGISMLAIWASFDLFYTNSHAHKNVSRLKQEIATQKILIEELDKSIAELKNQTKFGSQLSEQVQCINEKVTSLEQKLEQKQTVLPTPATETETITPNINTAASVLERLTSGKHLGSDEIQKYISLEKNASLKKTLEKLKLISDEPIKTLTILRTDLETLRSKIIQAKREGRSIEVPTPEGIIAGAWHRIKTKIRISKQSEIKADQPLLDIFECALKALNELNLELAIQTIERLESSQKEIAEQWLTEAKKRQALDQIITELKGVE